MSDGCSETAERFGRDAEGLEWAERLPVQDYKELLAGTGPC